MLSSYALHCTLPFLCICRVTNTVPRVSPAWLRCRGGRCSVRAAIGRAYALSAFSKYSISASIMPSSRSYPIFNPASAFLQCPLADSPRAANSAFTLLTCSGYSFCTRSRYSFLSFKSRAASNFLSVLRRLWVRTECQTDTSDTQSDPTDKTTAKFSCMLLLLLFLHPTQILLPLLPSVDGPPLHMPDAPL